MGQNPVHFRNGSRDRLTSIEDGQWSGRVDQLAADPYDRQLAQLRRFGTDFDLLGNDAQTGSGGYFQERVHDVIPPFHPVDGQSSDQAQAVQPVGDILQDMRNSPTRNEQLVIGYSRFSPAKYGPERRNLNHQVVPRSAPVQ